MNWKPGDNPDSVHRLNFPNCDFYMKLEPVEGIIILVIFSNLVVFEIHEYIQSYFNLNI